MGDVYNNEWEWIVLARENGKWIVVAGFKGNLAAAECAKTEAARHPGQAFFVAETTHVATSPAVEFRVVRH